ncbi:MAG: 4Fe-4S binding protein [Chloroflexi bacterium]|nr:4Fe-4S binding protein [Chloroflexota bacterium]
MGLPSQRAAAPPPPVERLVLGLAPGEYTSAEVQAQARKAGLDPMGVETLNLAARAALLGPPPVATERARLLLVAAVARARAFRGSRPEQLKASLSVSVSRRALFSLAVHEYHAVPAVLPQRCAADRGCRRCVDVCPREALQLSGRQLRLDRTQCEGCGLCVSACPREALDLPGASFAELDAQLVALLDPALSDLSPRGVLFACRPTAAALDAAVERGFRYPAGWLPVAVPCAGALSPAIFLRSLALGAAGVGVLPCNGHCPFAQDAALAERVSFCQELLGLMGAPMEQVRLVPLASGEPNAWALPAAPGEPLAPRLVSTRLPNARRAGGEAVLALARAYGAPADLVFAHPQAPWGRLQVDAPGCTVCGACAAVCPTGALALDRQERSVALTFDATLCVACELCVPRCPEAERGVLRLQRAVDRPSLEAGRVALARDQQPRCVACGAPLASTGMMARLAERLGEQYAALQPTITRYCSACRWRPGASDAGERRS